MRRAKRVFTPREGYAISKTDAQRFGAAIAALERRLKRAVTPQDIVEDGRDPSSVFHDLFQWDDATAAHEYRLVQARYVLRAIDVLLPEYGDAVVRGFLPISYGPKDEGFMSTDKALAKRPDVVNQQLRRLRDEAVRVEKDYGAWASLIEFEPAREFVVAARKMAKVTI